VTPDDGGRRQKQKEKEPQILVRGTEDIEKTGLEGGKEQHALDLASEKKEQAATLLH